MGNNGCFLFVYLGCQTGSYIFSQNSRRLPSNGSHQSLCCWKGALTARASHFTARMCGWGLGVYNSWDSAEYISPMRVDLSSFLLAFLPLSTPPPGELNHTSVTRKAEGYVSQNDCTFGPSLHGPDCELAFHLSTSLAARTSSLQTWDNTDRAFSLHDDKSTLSQKSIIQKLGKPTPTLPHRPVVQLQMLHALHQGPMTAAPQVALH